MQHESEESSEGEPSLADSASPRPARPAPGWMKLALNPGKPETPFLFREGRSRPARTSDQPFSTQEVAPGDPDLVAPGTRPHLPPASGGPVLRTAGGGGRAPYFLPHAEEGAGPDPGGDTCLGRRVHSVPTARVREQLFQVRRERAGRLPAPGPPTRGRGLPVTGAAGTLGERRFPNTLRERSCHSQREGRLVGVGVH